jgi:hypothetical protein
MGLGLSSVRSRLAHLYGARHQVEVGLGAVSVTRVVIALPYQPAGT